jgi:formylglycine-generating enzyme required for sulfatase activity
MPDAFEVEYGLNPLVDDAALDLDGDGTSNLDEYLDGTDPSQGDTDGDGVVDTLDNCHLPNPDQADADANGIGDPCDCRPIAQPGCVNPAPTFQSVLLDGEPVNIADDNGLGAVEYDYELATTEVTNAQYMDFLNAVAVADDLHGLYNAAMATDPQGGIERTGSPGSFAYRVRPNMANKPVNFVSWLDAARYANWLENGQPTGPPSNTTTEQGAFDLTVPDAGTAAVLDPDASWSLATEDEWYKAAYFDPAPPSRYVLFPTGSNIEPRPMQRDGLGNGFGGDLNYFDGPGGTNPEPVGVLTVGSGEPGSESAYGTRDQGGNVAEWMADDAEGGQRVMRGGGFRDGSSAFLSFPSPERSSQLRPPDHESDDVGIRIVRLIPEPEAWLLQAVALVTIAAVARWRGRGRTSVDRPPR